MYFIAAERVDWTEEDFLAAGEDEVARFVDPWMDSLPRPALDCTCLDIGCGLGRLTRALARRFAFAHGIDISPEMLKRAKSFAPPLPANLEFHLCDGSGNIPLDDESIDFVFSYLVLQHVPSLRIVKRYLSEIERVSRPGGLALLQVNTAVKPLRERFQVKIVASDKMPVVKRKLRIRLEPHSSMGVVVEPAHCAKLVNKHRLALLQMTGAGTQYTWLSVRKPGAVRAVGSK